jgi:proteasome lid subunit RPN8/RPN11
VDTRTLKASVAAAIVAHARAAAPEECCGILVGAGERIDRAVTARNIAKERRRRFLIEPKDHLDALRSARGEGLDVIGFYHSHPRSPAVPSPTDLAEANYPGYLFLIVSLSDEPPDLRLYQFRSGNFLSLPFVTVP